MAERITTAWAIAHVNNTALDGYQRWLEGMYDCPTLTLLFKTREEARTYIQGRYSYIRRRPDLRKEPHGIRMPQPVKVSVLVKEMRI
jgi:hypothetical protein